MRIGGVLLPIFSLSSPYGIGSLGRAGFEFIDFLQLAGQSIWQILPLSPTGYGDSPYQSFSSFGGNPYFIDLDQLAKLGLLSKEDYQEISWGEDLEKVDYELLYKNRWAVLRKAAKTFLLAPPQDYQVFLAKNAYWLEDYAIFMVLKTANNHASWDSWPTPLRNREPEALRLAREENKEELDFWRCVQYLFFHQWGRLKAYANQRGVRLMGDLPIYAAFDSADCWGKPEIFQLDSQLCPTAVAGVPPDGYTDEGQLWGNPLFRWDVLKSTGYRWWIQRLAHSASLYDCTRIDHFRGFESYYSIPWGEKDAKNGQWEPGPGIDFFRELHRNLGEISLVAEDLGHLTPKVHRLVEQTGYPGMKVLHFAFGDEDNSPYLPHNYPPHCVAYSGTHDNQTNLGWLETASAEEVSFAIDYLRLNGEEGFQWGVIKALLGSTANWVILQGQDLLGLGVTARINTPSTTYGNWQWRALPQAFTPELAEKMRGLMKLYRRIT